MAGGVQNSGVSPDFCRGKFTEPFPENHFLIMEEADLEQSATIVETAARMFSQYPAFTIIFSPADPQHLQFENRGNSPLVFTNPRKVFLTEFHAGKESIIGAGDSDPTRHRFFLCCSTYH